MIGLEIIAAAKIEIGMAAEWFSEMQERDAAAREKAPAFWIFWRLLAGASDVAMGARLPEMRRLPGWLR